MLASLPEDIAGTSQSTRYYWADLQGFFRTAPNGDQNPLVYEVFGWPEAGDAGSLLIGITQLFAGSIGSEPFHTRGHFHRDPDGPEYMAIYRGSGVLELGDREGHVTRQPLHPGLHLLVPPGHAHRVLNTGSTALVYLAISSGVVGHDYEAIAQLGWRHPTPLSSPTP